ncbi:acyl-ACP--UDP-N-acetylglucosamine O-acyltransferase, partial [Candidatus Sumerlaeota bacterium]|nr:acyl-ACP--UDP-N-acetylglucosamine O-acyltransferase [Candidatus Sumerlaeota bacterium]
MAIHPTAVVDPNAEVDPLAEIGPYAVIGPEVRIGPRTRIMNHAVITGRTTIGADNEIHTGAVIGDAPQHLGYKGAPTYTVIGDRNVIREYTSIHGSYVAGGQTIIGNDNYLMVNAHVAHDCRVGNRIVMCNCSMLGGHVEVEDQVFISALVGVHQFVRIGRLVMCAAVARITRDAPP